MVAVDKSTEKVMKLMHQTEKIRNVGVAAHIDHGKCVGGDSRVVLDDGEIMNAEELFNFSKNNGIKAFDENGTIIYDISKLGLKTFSLNKKSKKLEKKTISHAWKLIGGDVIKLSLRNGFGIKTTPEHKYVVFEDFEFKDKEAKDLKIGDRVICPRELDIENKFNIKSFILEKLAHENFYVFLKEDYGKNLKQKILSFGIEK